MLYHAHKNEWTKMTLVGDQYCGSLPSLAQAQPKDGNTPYLNLKSVEWRW